MPVKHPSISTDDVVTTENNTKLGKEKVVWDSPGNFVCWRDLFISKFSNILREPGDHIYYFCKQQ